MRSIVFSIMLLLLGNLALADQVADCSGTLDWDGTPVVAKVFLESESGKIIIQTKSDVFESQTKIQSLSNQRIRIYDNDFVMDFIVAPNNEANVGSFLNGQFFVSDFICRSKFN